MSRLNARWGNFWHRGQVWYHFWQDSVGAAVPEPEPIYRGGRTVKVKLLPEEDEFWWWE